MATPPARAPCRVGRRSLRNLAGHRNPRAGKDRAVAGRGEFILLADVPRGLRPGLGPSTISGHRVTR